MLSDPGSHGGILTVFQHWVTLIKHGVPGTLQMSPPCFYSAFWELRQQTIAPSSARRGILKINKDSVYFQHCPHFFFFSIIERVIFQSEARAVSLVALQRLFPMYLDRTNSRNSSFIVQQGKYIDCALLPVSWWLVLLQRDIFEHTNKSLFSALIICK